MCTPIKYIIFLTVASYLLFLLKSKNTGIGHSTVFRFSFHLPRQHVRDLLSGTRNHLFKLVHYQLPDRPICPTSEDALLLETVEFHEHLLGCVKLIYYISFKLYYADGLPKSTFVNKYMSSRSKEEIYLYDPAMKQLLGLDKTQKLHEKGPMFTCILA